MNGEKEDQYTTDTGKSRGKRNSFLTFYSIILLEIIVLLTVGGVLVYNRMDALIHSDENGTSVSVIDGADGPISIFTAGKLGGEETMTYKQISMDEAKQIFESGTEDSYLILDVRRADEFAAGHIPGAVNVANESIGEEPPVELPDKNQTIYVYCRSGNRSKQAAGKLATLGYKNIVEFGGILEWTGEIVK